MKSYRIEISYEPEYKTFHVGLWTESNPTKKELFELGYDEDDGPFHKMAVSSTVTGELKEAFNVAASQVQNHVLRNQK